MLMTEGDRDAISELQGNAALSADQAWAQYVTFTIDGCFYGIEITKVREIKGWSEPTDLPSSPNDMRGVTASSRP
jgi:purine-binding chemotaxis protein CheW